MLAVRTRLFCIAVVAWFVLVSTAWAEEPKPKTSGDKEQSKASAAPSTEKADPFQVPGGTAEELLKYIAGLRGAMVREEKRRIHPRIPEETQRRSS